MKAERRHELKTNTLDKVLTRAPDAGRKYGGMLLVVVLAAAAGYLLIRYRISSARETARAAVENLTQARNHIAQLGQLDLYPIPPQQKAELRTRWSEEAQSAINLVSQSADDPKLLAEALVAKGDLNWALAQLDELPGAATQASLRLQTNRHQLLGEAESAYDQVRTQYGDQKAAVIAATFGLAAIYEDLGQWDKAKTQYESIANDTSVADAFRTQAKIRLEKAAEWSQPVLLVAATTQPTTIGTTRPATTQPATTDAPTTQAAAATSPFGALLTPTATAPATAPRSTGAATDEVLGRR